VPCGSEAEEVRMNTGSPPIDRLIEAMNKHDADAMIHWLDPDYRSEQPLHPEPAFSGRDQVAKNWSLVFDEVPDLKVDLLRHAKAEGEVWTELRVYGQKLDGSPFEYRGIMLWGLRATG
jgi:hypothetical protein